MRLEYKATGELHYDRNKEDEDYKIIHIFTELCKKTKLTIRINSKRISFSGDPEEVSKAIKLIKDITMNDSPVAGYTRKQLTEIFMNSGGILWATAANAIEASVPTKVLYHGIVFKHMSCYFDVENMKFCYFSEKFSENEGFLRLSKSEAEKLKTE